MADHEIAPGGSSDDVARLFALTERQHELWTLLRESEDEDARNQVFDELTANRREIAALKEKATARGEDLPETPPPPRTSAAEPPARSVGEQLRAQIVSPPPGVAPPQPPPPPSPPPIEIRLAPSEDPSPRVPPSATEPPPTDPVQATPEPAEPDVVEPQPSTPRRVVFESPPVEPDVPVPETEEPSSPVPEQPQEEPSSPVPEQPQEEPEAPQPESRDLLREAAASSKLAPEPTPYRSRADDIAALRRELAGKEKRGPKVSDEVLEKRRVAAHDRYESVSRVRVRQPRLFPIVAVLVAVGAVGVAVWYSFFFDPQPSAAPPVTATTTTTTTTAAPVIAPENIVAAIQEAVDALGLGAVSITEQVGTVVLSGYVDTEADRETVIATAQGLAGSKPVDTSRLELTPTDEEIVAAVTQALGSDRFSDVDVSASTGIAVLTGVVDAEDRAELTDTVAAVAGVSRVVDATRTRDVAAELAAEVRRIGGPDPIVYAPGQLELTEEQQATVDEIAEAILAHPEPYVTLVGYTDPPGGAEENRQISQLRADLVRNYLVTQGVPAARLVVDGRGEDVPAGVVFPEGFERRTDFEIGYAVPPGTPADLRIGIVAPSARNDGAFTQSIFRAADLLAVDTERVAIDISEGTVVEEAADALRTYAAGGYDLVIAHGAGYGEAVATVATEYPGISFVWGPGSDTFDLLNVSAYDVAAGEGAYVLGAIAASLTSSDVIGIVGSLETGESQQYVAGFAAGIAATDSGIDVLTAYTGSSGDTTLAAAEAATQLEAGADVLTATDAMANGALDVAVASNALWFGNQADQYARAEDRVVASQVYHWELVLRQVVTGLSEGRRGGQLYTLNLGNGGLTIAYNPGYTLATDIIIAADTIIGEISSGALIVGG